MQTNNHRIFGMKFSSVYPLYVQKAERKGRTKEEVDQVIRWLTGYTKAGLEKQLKLESDFRTFFASAPSMNPNTALITGVVCGVRVEEIEDPLMQQIRWLDKLVDELAKARAMEKILRQESAPASAPAPAARATAKKSPARSVTKKRATKPATKTASRR